MQAAAGNAGRGRAGEHELEEHRPDTVLYYARAGDLEGVKRMVEADPRQVGSISFGMMGLRLCLRLL